jgi:hypothetical protein
VFDCRRTCEGDENRPTAILAVGNCPMNLEKRYLFGHGAGALAGDGDQLDPVAAAVDALS